MPHRRSGDHSWDPPLGQNQELGPGSDRRARGASL